jgi:aminoglycoside phosphotransferase (APT) family kinase protein
MSYNKEDIALIFQTHFHESVVSINEIKGGAMTFKYEVSLPKQKYIIKIYPPSRAFVASKEFYILNKAAAYPIKMPCVCFTGMLEDSSCLIYEKIQGQVLNFSALGSKDKERIATQVAENFSGLRQVRFARYGSLTEDEPLFDTWKAFLSHNIKHGIDNLIKADVLDNIQVAAIHNYLLHCLERFPNFPDGIVWSDMSQENIIIRNKELAGFIDFEGCFYGDQSLSLGYLFAREGESDFFTHIRKQLQPYINTEKRYIYFYAFLRLLRISQYLSLPLPAGRQRTPVLEFFKGVRLALDEIKN